MDELNRKTEGEETPLLHEEEWVELPRFRMRSRKVSRKVRRKGRKRKEEVQEVNVKGTMRRDATPEGYNRYHMLVRFGKGRSMHVFVDAESARSAKTKAYTKVMVEMRSVPHCEVVMAEKVDPRGWEVHPFTDYERHWKV